MENDTGWHLDRKVPIGIIAAIFAQSLVIGWWARGIEAQVETNAKAIALATQNRTAERNGGVATRRRIWDQFRVTDKITQAMREDLAAMKASMRSVERDVGRILKALEHK